MVSALGNRVCSSLVAGARVFTANLFSRLRVIASNSGPSEILGQRPLYILNSFISSRMSAMIFTPDIKGVRGAHVTGFCT